MDDNEYRRLCSQPDVMRRPDIRATATRLRAVQPDLAARVAALLETRPLPKPPTHDGGPETDFLWLGLPQHDVFQIVGELGDLEAQLAVSGASVPLLTEAGRLLDLWNAAESSRPAV